MAKATRRLNTLNTRDVVKQQYSTLPCAVHVSICRISFHCILFHLQNFLFLWEGADKSLARPTSPCRRTESIVSLKRGVCSCAKLQVSPCYRGWKEACQATRAIPTTLKHELSSRFFFFCKARHQRKFMPFWKKHQGNMHHCMSPSKTGWPSLKVVIFPPVTCLVLDDPKQ